MQPFRRWGRPPPTSAWGSGAEPRGDAGATHAGSGATGSNDQHQGVNGVDITVPNSQAKIVCQKIEEFPPSVDEKVVVQEDPSLSLRASKSESSLIAKKSSVDQKKPPLYRKPSASSLVNTSSPSSVEMTRKGRSRSKSKDKDKDQDKDSKGKRKKSRNRKARAKTSKSTSRSTTSQTDVSINREEIKKFRESLPPRAKSTTAKPSKPQTRTFRGPTHHTPGATPVYQQVEDGLRRLSINNGVSAPGAQSSRTGGSVPRQCKTVEDVARFITNNNAKNIIVMVGAGISTPSGIPDFRTPGTGLYDNLKQYHIPYPQAIFDIDYFETHPKPFYTIAKELYPTGKYRPNYVHYFLRLLHEKGVLMRVYTQNIDGLERLAGIPPMKIVEAHGTFLLSSCIRCGSSHASDVVKGLVKPNIVFFGEDLPRRFYYYLKDFPQADLLLVMGTSLEVEPFAGIVDAVKFYVPRILFNREAVGPFRGRHRANDVCAKGDIIRQIKRFTELLGWTDDLHKLIDECERKRGYKVPDYDSIDDAVETSSTSSKASDSDTSRSNKKLLSRSQSKPNLTNSHSRTFNEHRPPNNRQNSFSARTNTEITAIKNRMKINSHNASVYSASTTLPKIVRTHGGRIRPFHAQTQLYRTTQDKQNESEYFDGSDSDDSSSDESEESSSSDD